MEIRQGCTCLPGARQRWLWHVHRTTKPLHALLSTPLCVLTLVLGYGASAGLAAPLSGSSLDEAGASEYMDYGGAGGGAGGGGAGAGGGSISESASYGMESHVLGYPEGEGRVPGFRYSYHSSATQKHMYEGVVICLLAVTAFIGLVVWVLKSNFEERQTQRMRREASLRDRNSNVSPLMTPDSEES